MAAENAGKSPNYQHPPKSWGFSPLGRKSFLFISLFLLCITLIPFWGSIAVAAVFAFGLEKSVTAMSRKLGNRRRLTSLGFVLALALLLMFPATQAGMTLYQTFAVSAPDSGESLFSSQTMGRISAALRRVESSLVNMGVEARMFGNGGEVRQAMRQGASNAARQLIAMATAAVASLPQTFLSFLVFSLFLYVFLAYPRQIKRFSFRLNLFRPDDLKRAVAILKASSYNSLVTNFLVGLLQASIIAGGASAVGFDQPVLIFSVVFALSYIPFIGSAPVGYVLALISLLTGDVTGAVVMVLVATFAGLIDNVVRPYLVAHGGTEVHPVLTFASILGAIGVFGIKGIFLGPVIVTATVAFLGKPGAASGPQASKKKGGLLQRIRANLTGKQARQEQQGERTLPERRSA